MTESELREKLRQLLSEYKDKGGGCVTQIGVEWYTLLGSSPRIGYIELQTAS